MFLLCGVNATFVVHKITCIVKAFLFTVFSFCCSDEFCLTNCQTQNEQQLNNGNEIKVDSVVNDKYRMEMT